MKAIQSTRSTLPPWEPELDFGHTTRASEEVEYGRHEWYPTAEVTEQEKEFLLNVSLPPGLPLLDGKKPYRIAGELTHGFLTVHIPKRH
jgi:hypothetical protein